MSYARLYTLDGYRVQTPYGTRFVDHDGHVYALDAEQAAAVCDLVQDHETHCAMGSSSLQS